MPGLTAQTLRRFLPQSASINKGHLDQTRKNQKSTKNKKPVATDEHPNSDKPNTQTYTCFVAVYKPTGKIYTDQTGQFPIVLAQGNKYVMILYYINSNAILAKPFATKSATSIKTTFQKLLEAINIAGHCPTTHWLDNKCPGKLQALLQKEHIDFQLAPPRVHWRNAPKRAIRASKF